MIWKECGRKWLWPNLRYCPDISLKRLRKIAKNPIQDVGAPAEIRTGHFENASEGFTA
jgi:hypothetical protein